MGLATDTERKLGGAELFCGMERATPTRASVTSASSLGSWEAVSPKSLTKSSKLKSCVGSMGVESDDDKGEVLSWGCGCASAFILAKSCSTVGDDNMNSSE